MARIKEVEDAILQLETRNRVFQAVLREPGIHLSEVARQAALLVTHARYHLDQLAKAGLVSSDPQGGFVRYYARTAQRGIQHDVAGRREKVILDALRRRQCLHLVLLLVDRPSSLAELAGRLGKKRPTVLFHLERLVEHGLVERQGATQSERMFALRDTPEILRLLVRYPPPRSFVAAFVDLWDGLALPLEKGDVADPPAPGVPLPQGGTNQGTRKDRGGPGSLSRLLAWLPKSWPHPSMAR